VGDRMGSSVGDRKGRSVGDRMGRSVGDRIGLEAFEKRRISRSYRELNHEFLVAQPTAWPLTPNKKPVLETGTL
jgi:hypothetical protein